MNYNNKNNKFKIKIRKLFNLFCKKNLIKNIFGLKTKKKIFLIKFFLQLISINKHKKYKIKKTRLELIKYYYKLIKERKKEKRKESEIRKIIFFINRNLDYIIKKGEKKKIKLPFFFFNKYKKNLFVKLTRYFIKFYSFDLNKTAFICFWVRWYQYLLKHIYIYIKYVIYKLMFLLKKKKKLFELLIHNNKKVDKNLFLFSFFFNFKKNFFLNYYKMDSIYYDVYKLFNKNFYKKNFYSLFIFNFNKIKFSLKLITIKKNFILLKSFLKIRHYVFIKNFYYIYIFQFLINWFNKFIILNSSINMNLKNKFLINYKNFFNLISKFFMIIRKPKYLHFNVFKFNYFVYNNIRKFFF